LTSLTIRYLYRAIDKKNFGESVKINTKKVLLFLGFTYLFSWLLAFLFYGLGGIPATPADVIMKVVYMFVPMTMAIIVQKGIYKQALRQPLRISFHLNRWFLVAWLLPLIVAIATLGVNLLLPGIQYSPDLSGFIDRMRLVLSPHRLAQLKQQIETLPINPFWLGIIQGMIGGITINAAAGFGEELGWRGLLLKELLALGFWRSSLFIGAVWGFWHAPIILHGHNYPQHPYLGVGMMIVFCMLLSPLFCYITLKSGSVIAAAIVHGSLNGTAGLSIMLIKGGSDITVSVTGVAGFLVLFAANVLMWFYMKRKRETF
jgi:membrane protease YdiL (CAAX protease family)